MERVTVQYNGEMVTLDVPEGMSDDQIIAFLQQQDANKPSPIGQTQTQPSLADPATQVAEQAAAKGLLYNPQMSVSSPAGPVRPTVVNPTVGGAIINDVADLASKAGRITPKMIDQQVVQKPLSFLAQLPGAFAERYLGQANMQKTFGDMVKGAGKAVINPSNYLNAAKAVGGAVIAPENILAAPYTMAGYEMDRIRQDPTRPLTNTNPFTGNQVVQDTLEYNPYAQMTRGQAATQGAAGAQNRRTAIAGQQYGGLTPAQQQMLEQDRIDQAIRRKAAQKVLGPVIPQGY
jgi:hypothetical protein